MTEKTLYRSYMDSPYGRMIVMATDEGLSALEFVKPDRNKLLMKRLEKYFPEYETADGANVFIEKTGEWLTDYFQGNFNNLVSPGLDIRGTEFELKVWAGLQQIPLGKTCSYGELAAALGVPGGARAVGGANRRNPISIIVPCHRVIGHNDTLVGYGGGLDIKKALLSHEAPGNLFAPS